MELAKLGEIAKWCINGSGILEWNKIIPI